MEFQDGTYKTIQYSEYYKKLQQYDKLAWDVEEYSRNFINNKYGVQYENCTTFYCNDFQITFGYAQIEIYNN